MKVRRWVDRLRASAFNDRQHRATKRFVEIYGHRILQGPFAGLDYVADACGSELLPKLLGSYEAELHSVIDQVIHRRYAVIVDIGCAEGYYAAGLAYRCPWAEVRAYDMSAEARSRCQQLVDLNKLQDQVRISDRFAMSDLRDLAGRSCLVVCDIEGDELALLESCASEHLAADWLIELHGMVQPKVHRRVIEVFADTHDVHLIDSRNRDPATSPALWYLRSDTDRYAALSERRVPMQWAWIERRATAI